jgi:hypothetical protein
MNILADHHEYKPFFKNPEAEIPEVKNLSEFENDPKWYNLTLTVKTQFISLLTEWRINSLVIINDIELQKLTSSFLFSSLFKDRVVEIEKNIMQLTTNKAKCEYLIRSITEEEKINKLNGIPIEKDPYGQKIIRYLKFELEYYKQVMELPDQENQKEPRTREDITQPRQILLFEKLGIVKYLKDKYKLNPGTLAKVISILSNSDFDNAKSYLRYVTLPKDRIPPSKKNYDPKTSENIEFMNRTLIELGLSE